MATCLVALGSNLGNRQEALDSAVEQLSAWPGVRFVVRSRYYQTDPVGGPAQQGKFLNAAAQFDTALSPQAFLAALQETERRLGRHRGLPWAARPVDLDLLLYEDRVVAAADLVVPHPRMAFRRFVLVPAVEVAPRMVHPLIGWTLTALLEHLDTATNYVAIAGRPGSGKTWLARGLQRRFGAQLVEDGCPRPPLGSAPADEAGHALQAELRFLQARSRALSGRWKRAGAVAGGWVVSDFWFGQSLAYARNVLQGSSRAVFEEAYRNAAGRVMQPKLIVVMADFASTGEAMAYPARAADPAERERPGPSGPAIVDEARAAGLGPTLWLSAHRRDDALTEASAAIEAMDASHVSS